MQKNACFCHYFAVLLGMINKEKIMKTNNTPLTPLQKFKILKQKELVDFLVNRFDWDEKEATALVERMPGGFKVQVI